MLSAQAKGRATCEDESESPVKNENSNPASGDVVSGLDASELVEIQQVTPFGNKTLIQGVGLHSRRLVKRPLTAEDLAALVEVRGHRRIAVEVVAVYGHEPMVVLNPAT